MGMTRYNANTGRREHIPEPMPAAPEKREPPRQPGCRGGQKPADPFGLLGKLSLSSLEPEDLLLLVVIWLLYRESGERELLITLGALLLL